MHICIFRRRFTPWGVDGTMVINGKFFCGTLERPQSYLKADAYRLALVPVSNPKFLRDDEKSRIMPVILKENGRVPKSVIRKPFFVPGNGPYKLMYGSIILGRSYISGLVLHSKDTSRSFARRWMRQSGTGSTSRSLSETGALMRFRLSIYHLSNHP